MNHSDKEILDLAGEVGHVWLVLATVKDTAWNPASTHRLLRGPCLVEYTFHDDGGVDAVVSLHAEHSVTTVK